MADIDCEANSFDKLYPRVIDRYFTRFYDIGADPAKKEFGVLLQHSNNLFVLYVAQENGALEGYKAGNAVDMKFSQKVSNMKLSGKRKHGSVNLRAGENFMTLVHEGKTFEFKCPIDAQILEVNAALKADKLFSDPEGDDQYIAILSTKNIPKSLDKVVNTTKFEELLRTTQEAANAAADEVEGVAAQPEAPKEDIAETPAAEAAPVAEAAPAAEVAAPEVVAPEVAAPAEAAPEASA